MSDKQNPYLEGFHAWLKNHGMTDRSSDSYCSGMNRVNDEFFKPLMGGKDLFVALEDAIQSGTAVDWLTALSSYVAMKAAEATEITEKKRLQDRNTRLRKFTDYVETLQKRVITDGESFDITKYIPDEVIFYDRAILERRLTRKSIFRPFVSATAPIVFIPSLLDKIFEEFGTPQRIAVLNNQNISWGDSATFTANERYVDWHRKMVRCAQFLTRTRQFMLKDMDGVYIDASKERAFVVAKGHQFELISPSTRKPLKVRSLFDIAVRPTTEIETLLRNHESSLIALKVLTDFIHKETERVSVEVKDFDFNKGCEITREANLWELNPRDQWAFADYILPNILKELGTMLPHLLLDLNQLSHSTTFIIK